MISLDRFHGQFIHGKAVGQEPMAKVARQVDHCVSFNVELSDLFFEVVSDELVTNFRDKICLCHWWERFCFMMSSFFNPSVLVDTFSVEDDKSKHLFVGIFIHFPWHFSKVQRENFIYRHLKFLRKWKIIIVLIKQLFWIRKSFYGTEDSHVRIEIALWWFFFCHLTHRVIKPCEWVYWTSLFLWSDEETFTRGVWSGWHIVLSWSSSSSFVKRWLLLNWLSLRCGWRCCIHLLYLLHSRAL